MKAVRGGELVEVTLVGGRTLMWVLKSEHGVAI